MLGDLKTEVGHEAANGSGESLAFVRVKVTAIEAALQDKQVEEITILPVTERTSLADFFIVATVRNPSHAKVAADVGEELMETEFQLRPRRIEGLDKKRWILLDYGSIIVHLMRREEREFYKLDHLWDIANSESQVEK